MIGGCAQDPHIFDTTIAGNLRLARPAATDEQLASAAGRAGLLPWIAVAAAGLGHPASVRTARRSPAASGSGWPWPGRCSPTPR